MYYCTNYRLQNTCLLPDINECNDTDNVCEQNCENTIGSYNCLCVDGYELNETDLSSCDGKYCP